MGVISKILLVTLGGFLGSSCDRQESTNTLKYIQVIGSRGLAYLNAGLLAFMLFVLYKVMTEENGVEHSFIVFFTLVFLLIITVPQILIAIKGFWSIEVNGDDIYVYRLFRYRHFTFSDLDHWNGGSGTLDIWTKSGYHFATNGWWAGSEMFEKRLKKERIPVG